jgi:DHA2 family multidrug resistance protein-like MFS transporter
MAQYEGLPVPQRHWAAVAIWLALALSVLDGSIANIALPTIARTLSAPPAESVWVVNAYQLTIVVSLLPLAALGEIVGYRRVFGIGVVLFTLASLGCTLAGSLTTLAIARAIQGLGAACIMSENGALMRFTYPPHLLGRGIGLNALVISVTAAIGPTVASGILAVASWQWLFAINVPIGIVTLLIGRKSLPTNPTSGVLDIAGTILNVLMFGLAFIGIDLLTRAGFTLSGVMVTGLGTVAGILLVLRSRKQLRPLIPLDLLKSGLFTLSVTTSIISFSAQMLAFVSLPFYFEDVLHRSAVETGLLMTPWPLAVGIGAPISGRLADRFPAAILGGIGLFALMAGLALLAMLPAHATTLDIVWRMALCGLGFGIFQAPNNRTMLFSAPLDRSGAAGGMLATARITGQTIGATLAAIAFRFAAHADTVALGVASGLAGIAIMTSLARLSQKPAAKPATTESIAASP